MWNIALKSSLLAISLILPLELFAEESNQDPEAEKGQGAVSQLALASELGRLGLEEKDPLLIMTAAKIMKLVSIEDSDLKRTRTEGTGQGEGTGEGERLTADSLLASATSLVGDNKAYLDQISEISGLKARGASWGANRTRDSVQAGATDYYDIQFDGRRFAEVAVSGDGDTDLDLFIEDEYGNSICEDTDYSDDMYCSWTPRRTGYFTVYIKNLGSVYNDYYLYTN